MTRRRRARQPAPVPPVPVPVPSAPPPGSWVQRVSELLRGEHDLPRLVVDPGQSWQRGGAWQLYPWAVLQDVTALLEWARHLDGSVTPSWRGPQLVVAGRLAGEPTELVGVTDRVASPCVVTMDLLVAAALDEQAARRGLLLDEMASGERADPLGTAAGDVR